MNEIRVPQERIAQVRGRVGLWNIRESGLIEPIGFKRNQIQYSWGYIAAQCMGRAAREYAIRYMYIEYENVATAGDIVEIPDYGRDEGVEYYEQLYNVSNRDYLRVPMIVEPMISIATGFEDYFHDGVDGNKLTFFAQTQAAGADGLAHGGSVPFGSGTNSTVFGAALVAAPGGSDRSQDVIFARTYFLEDEQTVKEVSSQLGITWETVFE